MVVATELLDCLRMILIETLDNVSTIIARSSSGQYTEVDKFKLILRVLVISLLYVKLSS